MREDFCHTKLLMRPSKVHTRGSVVISGFFFTKSKYESTLIITMNITTTKCKMLGKKNDIDKMKAHLQTAEHTIRCRF